MGKQTPMGFAGALSLLSQALFSAPVVPKKVESETKKSDDESEGEATDGVRVGGWVVGRRWWDESRKIRPKTPKWWVSKGNPGKFQGKPSEI